MIINSIGDKYPIVKESKQYKCANNSWIVNPSDRSEVLTSHNGYVMHKYYPYAAPSVR